MNIFQTDLSKSFLYGSIAVGLLIAVMIMINPVDAMQITGTLKSTGVDTGPIKGYYLTNVKITDFTRGKAVGMISLIGGDPIISIGQPSISTMGSIKTQVSPTETKMIDFALSTNTDTIKKVGSEEITSAKGIAIINHKVINDATSQAKLNGDTGTLQINVPEPDN